jgi:conjugal transfer pilin signal peptidase TrbI
MPSVVDFDSVAYNKKLTKKLNRFFHKKCTRNLIKKLGFISLLILLIYGIAATQIQLVLNATPSLPYKLFVLSKRSHPCLKIPSKDRFILFYKSEVGVSVVKQVKGLPGSEIHYDEQGRLWVDDFCVGKPHIALNVGKPVTAIQAGIIPPNFVFAYGSHDRSFDSRYAEFGLIPVRIIKGVGVALL